MKQKIFFFTLIFILFISFFNIYSNKNKTIERQKNNIEAIKDSATYFKNKLNQEVATKLALQLTEKELSQEKKINKDLEIALKRFKKTIAVVQSKQDVRIDTVRILFKDSIPCVFERFNTINDNYYQFNLKVNQIGSIVSDFKLTPNKQALVIGEKKKNFFSNSELRVDITNSNKLFNQNEIKPFVIIYKKSWYEKPQITIPIGFALGLLVD